MFEDIFSRSDSDNIGGQGSEVGRGAIFRNGYPADVIGAKDIWFDRGGGHVEY